MKLSSLKSILCLSLVFLCFGCATNSAKNEVIVDCNQTLSIVESPKNVVSEDGFTILYDGKGGDTLEKLLKEALKKQIAHGCKNG
ncbi:hypothetical protein [Aliikangiella sp. IMCC44359]|uniref:hypothetical protein n=1 Tax=Aliikangiella sp. IMCC44359 TaxID=3459125 RepID=UPI00403AEE67